MPATLTSRLPQITVEMQAKVAVAEKAGAELVAERARERAPDAPPMGEGLVEAIHAEQHPEGSYVLTDWKAHFLEFGTSKMAAQPFLIPAAEESTDAVAALVTAALRGL